MYSLKTKNQSLTTSYPMNLYVTDEEIEYIVGNL